MRLLILVLVLGLATSASADQNNENSCHGNCSSNEDGGGGSGDATATGGDATATGGDATATGGKSKSNSESSSTSTSSSDSVQGQGQGQATFVDDHSVIQSNGDGIKAAGREHAETAGDVRSRSGDAITPCGDSSGLSGQVGVAGGGLATITETCRAFRLQMLQRVDEDDNSVSTKLAAITYYVGWFPRLLLHVASFGVLN